MLTYFVLSVSGQMWNELDRNSGISNPNRRRRPTERVQAVPSAYDIVDTASAVVRGPPAKNCTGGGCCIPKCFAEKGNRGLPGLLGLSGEKGEIHFTKIEKHFIFVSEKHAKIRVEFREI